MTGKLFNIFQNKRFWFFCIKDSRNVEKEGAACVIESFFMTDNAKWLTGKSSQKYVMIRDIFRFYFCDISRWLMAEICFVGAMTFAVDVAGKNAFGFQSTNHRGPFYCETESTDAAEEIDEPKGRLH